MTARSAIAAATLLLTALTATPPATAQSEPPERFHVEVIVFARTQAAPTGEWWSPDPGMPPLDAASEIPDPPRDARTGEPDGLRAARSHHLAGVARRLGKDEAYRRVAHVAWTQPLVKDRAGAPVAVRGERELTLPPPEPVFGPNGGEVSLSGSEDGALLLDVGAPRRVPELEGTVTVWRGRYLHAGMDLVFRTPQAAASESHRGEKPDQAGSDRREMHRAVRVDDRERIQAVRLTQKRRVRAGELHYFDHPLFGALLRIRELERSETAASGSES